MTSVPDDLKFIGKLIQRSTTSMLMTSSNSDDLEVKLRFEVDQILFQNFSETVACYCAECIRKSALGLPTSVQMPTLA